MGGDAPMIPDKKKKQKLGLPIKDFGNERKVLLVGLPLYNPQKIKRKLKNKKA